MTKCNHEYIEVGIDTGKFKCKKCGKPAKTMTVNEILESTKNLPSKSEK